jgi:hypothetical protein
MYDTSTTCVVSNQHRHPADLSMPLSLVIPSDTYTVLPT